MSLVGYTEASDSRLLEQFLRQGDQAAFAQITQRYGGLVYATCYRVLGDSGEAEDAAQETFLRLVRKPEAVSQSVGGWLHRVATHIAIDMARRDISRRRRETGYARAVTVETSGWDELSPLIDEALTELEPEQQALLVEHFVAGKSQRELASANDTSPATLSRRIKEALEALRARLKQKGVLVGGALLAGLMVENVAKAVPPTLARELGKLAMVSGGARATAAAAYWKGLALAGAAALVLAGATWAGAVWVGVQFPGSRHATAAKEDRPAVAPPAAGRATADTLPRYILVPGARELDSGSAAIFQDPRTGDGKTITVVFGDNHAVTMSIDEAQKLLQSQTGKTMADLVAHGVAAEAPAPH